MAYEKAHAQHEFTRWSESYDRSVLQWLLFGPSHGTLIRRIRAAAPQRPFTILDVGCGTGVFAARLRKALPNAQVWGVDLNAGMLVKGAERWRHHRGSVQAVQGDSEHLPFPDGSFDFLTCANSFHHYPRQDRAVAEMRRVLRPGGRLLLIDGFRDAPWGWFVYDVCVAKAEGEVHHASRKEFRRLFEDAGLSQITQRVNRGFAPFVLTEGVGPSPTPAPGPSHRPATAGLPEACDTRV